MIASLGLTRPLCGKEGTCVCFRVDEDVHCVCGDQRQPQVLFLRCVVYLETGSAPGLGFTN